MAGNQPSDIEGGGTKFRLFPQSPVLEAFAEPETVWVSLSPAAIAPGPADDRMQIVDAVNKQQPYDYPYLPPYLEAVHHPIEPSPDGHFDHLPLGCREFEAAHMYGTLRFVLDIWEGYFNRRIDWHFRDGFDRLELIPWLDWENAQAGYGFIETGYGLGESGQKQPYALNFDVLAHELGHLIIYSEVGVPAETTLTAEFTGFQESAADLVALVSVLYFDSVVDHVLHRTAGNLYSLNEVSRIGELSETEQIRVADNTLTMSGVADVSTPVGQLSQAERHRLGQPLTGAVFDIFVDAYQDYLVQKELISADLDRYSGRTGSPMVDHDHVQAGFANAYRGRHRAFKEALLEARDDLGLVLAVAWGELAPDNLSYVGVRDAMLTADLNLTQGQYQDAILESFAWREIGVGT